MTAYPAGAPAFGPPRGQSWHAPFAVTPPGRSSRLSSRARVLAGLLVASVAVLGSVVPVQAAVSAPKVVIIVGPVGGVTDSYRNEADKAARVARRAGADVVTVYSPDATWSAVRRAVDGASILVYMGHGNGWPSRYRDSLYPPTQNGFGLNPVAGNGDAAHQYFGEASIDELHLAHGAIVLLHHLCYASGNSEPGLPEGTQADAIARVDNYAAGFIRAGARAVVAEGHLGPAYYVRALLEGRLSVGAAWAGSPTANGHTFALASVRSPGFTQWLDPDRASGGFYRSLVATGAGGSLAAPGGRGATSTASVPAPPSLVGSGVVFGSLTLDGPPTDASSIRLVLPISAGVRALKTAKVRLAIRWDPIIVDAPPGAGPPDAEAGPGPTLAAATAPTPSAAPAPTPSADPTAPVRSGDPSAPPTAEVIDPAPSAAPATTVPEPPDVQLVVPERAGEVVDPVSARVTAQGLEATVAGPELPGLYRLVVSVHTADGEPYDAATQALVVPAFVRVGGAMSVAYGAPASIGIPAAGAGEIAVAVLNAGTQAWDAAAPGAHRRHPEPQVAADRSATIVARLTATWVSPEGRPVPPQVVVPLDPSVTGPGGKAVVRVPLAAPGAPGAYLVLLDVIPATGQPLSATGSTPALIRVLVGPPDPPRRDRRAPIRRARHDARMRRGNAVDRRGEQRAGRPRVLLPRRLRA